MQQTKQLLLASTLTLLSVTASASTIQLTQAQCENANWYKLGHKDGKHGQYLQQALNDYQQHCARFQVAINTKKYKHGWKEGVKDYCGRIHGYVLGAKGKLYNNVCPPDLIVAFNRAWNQGINAFCTPTNGFKLGKKGKTFPGFCPPWADAKFNHAYAQGKIVFKEIRQLHKQQNSYAQSLLNIEKNIQTEQETLAKLQSQLLQKIPESGYRRELQRKVNHHHAIIVMHENQIQKIKQRQEELALQIKKLKRKKLD